MNPKDKDLVWLHGEVKTPPFSLEARLEASYLLRQLQQGIKLAMPQSRQCRRLAGVAMSYELMMKTAPGELCTEPIPMRLFYWKFLIKNKYNTKAHNRYMQR